MAVNVYFNNYLGAKTAEQLLYDDLIVESIQIHGHDVWYLPRGSDEDNDNLFGENVNSRFTRAYLIDIYINNVEGFTGDQDFFSKFGLEIRDNANFVVARRTFERWVPSNVRQAPRDGDLLYVPVMRRIFEIKFTEEESYFFGLGQSTPYVYELRCEQFRASNEEFATGIEVIDNIDLKSSYTIEMVVTGNGNFYLGETVYQGANLAAATMTATVSSWDNANNILQLVNIAGEVQSNASLIGANSNTTYLVSLVDSFGDYVYYDSFDNLLIQQEANNFVDLSEVNPFGLP